MLGRDGRERLKEQVKALLVRQPAGGDQLVRTRVAWTERDVGHRIGDRDHRRPGRSEQVLVGRTIGFRERH